MSSHTTLIQVILGLAVIAALLAGVAVYRTYHVQAPPATSAPATTATTAPTSPAAPPPQAPVSETPTREVAGQQNTAEPGFAQFARDGYEAVCAEKADLRGDGGREWIIGYQSTRKGDMGYPADPAYFELLRYDRQQGGWVEWMTLSVPPDYNGLDDHSIRAIFPGPDGKVIVELVCHGFGVSSRAEPVCLYKITDDGATKASDPFPIPKTSDDVVVRTDALLSFPGEEIVLAQAILGDEAHFAPHRYNILVYGWDGGVYRSVKTQKTGSAYNNGTDAIESTFGVEPN